jgi:putative transposase
MTKRPTTPSQRCFSVAKTVCGARGTRIRYLNEGLHAALEDQPRSGREPSLNAQQEAYLIALACSDPPAGQERWTLELLAQHMVTDEQVETLSPETVRLTLKKTNSNLG